MRWRCVLWRHDRLRPGWAELAFREPEAAFAELGPLEHVLKGPSEAIAAGNWAVWTRPLAVLAQFEADDAPAAEAWARRLAPELVGRELAGGDLVVTAIDKVRVVLIECQESAYPKILGRIFAA